MFFWADQVSRQPRRKRIRRGGKHCQPPVLRLPFVFRLPSILLLFCLGLPACVLAAPDADAYADRLVERAHALGLSQSRQWHALMHYRRNWILPGVTGQADDPAFYLARRGKTDPRAELDATLRAFFAPALQETADVQHPQCRFVARYQWLKEALDFDPARLPEQPCPRFSAWREALQATELTLVFPSAYINNPSSMFGHTLLRVDGADQNERTRLLAYAINYAVNPGGDGQVKFIFKSMTGFYPGEFSIAPYYVKVKEYSDLENRDIWEYRLDFTPGEIERLLRHAWELGETWFDYYFFDENCAYHLLSLFEVARPGLELSTRFRGWVIPVDTVRAMAGQPGMVKEVVYRPAGNTRLRERLDELSGDERALVRRIVDGAYAGQGEVAAEDWLDDLPPARRALVLDGAYMALRHDTGRGRVATDESARRSRELLLALSRLPEVTLVDPAMPAIRPEQAHGTRRLALGAGREAGRDYLQLSLRPAYNDLLDPPGGYAEGAQINFLDLGFRHDTRSDRTRLEHVHVIDVLSIAPRDAFFRPVSWRLGTGFVHKRLADGRRPMVWRSEAGAGLAAGRWERLLGYVMIEGTLDVSGRLEHGHAIGLGPKAGLHLRPHPQWKVHLYARAQEFRAGMRHHEREVALEQSLALGMNHALRLSLGERHDAGSGKAFAQFAWHVYF